MKQKYLMWLFVVMLVLIFPASATSFNVTDNIIINLDNGAYITLSSGQNFSNTTEPVIKIYNSSDTPSSTLEINFNNTKVRWNTLSNHTISSIHYTSDNLTFTRTEISGYLNTTLKPVNSLSYYNFKVNGTINQTKLSDSNSYVWFNYSLNATSNFEISRNTLPSVLNITLSPLSASETNNLTVSLNGTDTEGSAITKHYLWYKNGVLNNSWNDTETVLYDNFTSGDSFYVKGYVNDGYENSSQLQSNTLIIGSNNSAPSLVGITLSSDTRKFGKNIFINTSSNITDNESSSVIFKTYYYSGADKIYLTNTTWFAPPNNASVNITIPWNDGLSHTIYAQVEDNGNASGYNNLTSSEVYATFTSDINPPVLLNNSLSKSRITPGTSLTIYMNTECDQTAGYSDCSINNVKVKILQPEVSYGNGNDGTGNWSMLYDGGTAWHYTYTSTSGVGAYYVDDYYITDNSNITKHDTSDLVFVVYTQTSSGGGGAPSIPSTNLTPTYNATQYVSDVLKIKLLTEGLPSSLTERITTCYMNSIFQTGEDCSSLIIFTEGINWYALLGVFLGAFLVLFGLAYQGGITKDEMINVGVDTAIYGILSLIIIQVLMFAGLNMYFLNYLFQSNLAGFIFASVALESMFITITSSSVYEIAKRYG